MNGLPTSYAALSIAPTTRDNLHVTIRGGGACLPLSKWWGPPSDAPPPPPEWAGGFEGKGYIPGAKGARKVSPLYLPCVGQSVSRWVPLEVSPSPPWGGGVLKCCGACQRWVPPLLILPPSPPLLLRKALEEEIK